MYYIIIELFLTLNFLELYKNSTMDVNKKMVNFLLNLRHYHFLKIVQTNWILSFIISFYYLLILSKEGFSI